MRIEERQSKKVVSLAEYKCKRGTRTEVPDVMEDSPDDEVLQEVSYHLVMAARAIAHQKKK